MRRKDVLIIVSVFVIIAFLTVGIMYAIINGTFERKENVQVIAVNKDKKEYYKNGWETAIIKEIRDNIPIPVGFTYVEGKKDTGIIIEDDQTKERYMWIPTEYTEEKAKAYIELVEEKYFCEENYQGENSEINECTEKYGGFYVALEDKKEVFDEYAKKHTNNFEEYYDLKQRGVEEFEEIEKIYEGLNTQEISNYDDIVKEAEKKYCNSDAVKSSAITKEQLAKIVAWGEEIGETICINSNRTILGVSIESTMKEGLNQIKEEFGEIYEEIKEEEMDEYLKDVIKGISTSKNEGTIKSWWLQLKNYCKKPEHYVKEKGKTYEDEEIEKIKETILKNFFNSTEEGKYNLADIIEKYPDKVLEESNKEELIEYFKKSFIGSEPNKEIKGVIQEILEEQEKKKQDKEGEDKTEEKVTYVEYGKGKTAPVPEGFTSEIIGNNIRIKNGDNLSFIWIEVEDITKSTEELKENLKKYFSKNSESEINEQYFANRNPEGEVIDEETKESIKKYKGFYIGEAEIGTDREGYIINIYREVEEKENGYLGVANGEYDRTTDLEYAKSKAQEVYASSQVVSSHLTYGAEWDAVINYLIKENELKSEEAFENSNEIGKYRENIRNNKMIGGIFGLAGNLNDMTQETVDGKVVTRGGSYDDEGTVYSSIASSKLVEEDEKQETGYRIVLIVNTKYEENEELEEIKKAAKEKIENYIKTENWEYINEDTKVIKDIVDYGKVRIDSETSGAIIDKVVEYVKTEISRIDTIAKAIKEYGENTYTYPEELQDKVENMKNEEVERIKNANYNGATGSFGLKSEIQNALEEEIEKLRSEYRDKIYTEEIENYINNYYSDKVKEDWVIKLKEKAKEEINYTNDLANLVSVAVRYQEIIEVTNKFENTEPNSWDYYEIWKNEYEKLKKEYINRIVNEAKNKEEAENLAKEGMEKINERTSEVILKEEIDKIKANGEIKK